MPPLPTFACIVLAAGAGTRFGNPKARATLADGRTFLQTVVQTALASGADPVVAVVRRGEQVPGSCIAVENPDPLSEQIESLRLGLARLSVVDLDGAIVWPVDCPLVRRDTIEAIVDAVAADGAEIVVPTFGGRQGHPTWFARDTWPELMRAGSDGAREVVRRDPTRVQRVPVTDRAVLTDIDTREDLARALVGAELA